MNSLIKKPEIMFSVKENKEKGIHLQLSVQECDNNDKFYCLTDISGYYSTHWTANNISEILEAVCNEIKYFEEQKEMYLNNKKSSGNGVVEYDTRILFYEEVRNALQEYV